MKTVSCIIPAYNEAARIDWVLSAVLNHPLLAEVIVIDDCSTDDTLAVVQKRIANTGLKVLVHSNNMGKSNALLTGIRAAQGEFLLFIDADLENLTAENITSLVSPVIQDLADVSISLRRNAPPHYRKFGLDFISGERVLPKSLITEHLDEIASLRPFGFEVFLNRLMIKSHVRLAIVDWPLVNSPYKYKKVGLWKGIKGDARMTRDILRTITLWEMMQQMYRMRYTLTRK